MSGTPYTQIRADYDRDTIVVYQAYRPEIADAALQAGRFVEPWSGQRMTWIKPSFLWMMERANWGQKSGQERILAIRIGRHQWDKALSQGVLSHAENQDADAWRLQMEQSPVRIQWDPERCLSGSKLSHRSIQVGLGRPICQEYAARWITEIRDLTELARKIRQARDNGDRDQARKWLPPERPYPVSPDLARRLGMKS